MITGTEKNRILKHIADRDAKISIKIVSTPDARSDIIRKFGREIKSLGVGVTFKEITAEAGQIPSIELAPNIHYAGVPSGSELLPFLRMLTASRVSPPPLPRRLSVALETISLPAQMHLYVLPLCRHCPRWVDTLFPIAWANPNIKLLIIDAQMFDRRAAADGVQAVPTLIVDSLLRAAGTLDVAEMVTFLQTRKPSSMGPLALKSMLDSGRAALLAQLMAAEGVLFGAFLQLLTDPKWPVRLGAMVTLEELGDLNPELAADAIEDLRGRLDRVADEVKGDILYLIGENGGPDNKDFLSGIAGGRHTAEVREAAADALQALEERFSG